MERTGPRERWKVSTCWDIPRQSVKLDQIAPWLPRGEVQIHTSLPTPIKRTDPDEVRKAAAEQMMATLPVPAVRIFTDGSAEGGTFNGGSGVLIQNINSGHEVEMSFAAGLLVSSYGCEMRAFLEAFQWIIENADNFEEGSLFQIFSDSKSGLQRLEAGPSQQKDFIGCRIWKLLMKPELKKFKIAMFFVPSHCGIPGNERADTLANAGRIKPQQNEEVDFKTVSAQIRRRCTLKGREVAKENREILAFSTDYEAESSLPRHHRRILAQCRAGGHCPQLNQHAKRIGLTDDASCRHCGELEETIDHIITDCPALTIIRQQTMGNGAERGILASDPKTAADFLGQAGLFASRQ